MTRNSSSTGDVRISADFVYTYLEYEFTDHVFGVPPEQGDTLMGRSFQSSVQVSCRIQCEYLYVSIHLPGGDGGDDGQLLRHREGFPGEMAQAAPDFSAGQGS